METAEILKRFVYHRPDNDKADLHQLVRSGCMALAEGLNNILPESREKSLAMTKLEEAMFWANAAVARNG